MRGSAFVRFPLAAFVMKSWGADRDGEPGFLGAFLWRHLRGKAMAVTEMRERILIFISRKRFIPSAERAEHKSGFASHLYLAKAFTTNAAKDKNAQSCAPHLYQQKAFHLQRQKGRA